MENFQSYFYVGSKEIAKRVEPKFEGTKIFQIEDILKWVTNSNQTLIDESIIATFIINEKEELVINDRHSEHIMCAGGNEVLSAGEITFSFENTEVCISEITNQSTGYCPKIASWKVVEMVLNRIGIEHPNGYTRAYEFRFCEHCQTKNLIKEAIYECAVCGADLDLEWNIDKIKL